MELCKSKWLLAVVFKFGFNSHSFATPVYSYYLRLMLLATGFRHAPTGANFVQLRDALVYVKYPAPDARIGYLT